MQKLFIEASDNRYKSNLTAYTKHGYMLMFLNNGDKFGSIRLDTEKATQLRNYLNMYLEYAK